MTRYEVHSIVEHVEPADSASEGLLGLIEVLSTLNGLVDRFGWLLDGAQHLDDAFGRDWRNRVRGTRD